MSNEKDPKDLALDDLEAIYSPAHADYGASGADPTTPGYVPVKPDIPQNTSLARSHASARSMALEMTGKIAPNKCRFLCQACGWDKTLEFEKDELEAIPDRDPRNWPLVGGQCLACSSPTIIPYDMLAQGIDEFRPANARARENRREDYRDAAKEFVGVVKDELIGGGITAPGSTLDQPPAEAAGGKAGGPPRDGLPDADDVDISTVKPRGT